MKPKTTLYLFIALIVLGLVYYFWDVKGAAEREIRKERANSLITVDQDSVGQVTLYHHGDKALTYQRENGQWRITYPVNTGAEQGNITSSLSTILDAKKDRTISDQLTDLKPYGLDNPQVKVEITYSDTGHAVLLIGDENPTSTSVFVKRGNSDAVYTSKKNLLAQANKGLADLRDKSVLHFTVNDITRFTIDRKSGRDLEFRKYGGDWRIEGLNISANNSTIQTTIRRLASSSFVEVSAETDKNPAKYGLNNPEATAKLYTNDSTQVAALVVGDESNPDNSNPNYYVRDLSRPMVFTVRHSTVENLLKSAYDLQDTQLFKVSGPQITAFQITWEDTTYQFTRPDSVWKTVGRQVNTPRMNQMADGLSGLHYDGLASYNPKSPAAYGFNHPWMVVRFDVSGSEFDGFTVGKEAGDGLRYIKLDSSPYVYKIKETKLERYKVDLKKMRPMAPEATGG